MQPSSVSIWLHDSNETASGKHGTLQIMTRKVDGWLTLSRPLDPETLDLAA